MSNTPKLAIAYIDKSAESAGRAIASMPPAESAAFVEQLPTPQAVKLIAGLQPGSAAQILEASAATTGAAILRDLGSSAAAAIVRRMDRSNRNRLLAELPSRLQVVLQRSLSFAQGTVGAHMTTAIATLSASDNAASVIDVIRQADRDQIDVVFVLDDARRLVGAVTGAVALRHATETPVSEIMDDTCPAVSAYSRLEAVADPALWHDLPKLPVVNRQQEVVGAISRKALRPSGQTSISGGSANRSMLAAIVGALTTTSAGLANLAVDSLDRTAPGGDA